MEEELHIEKRGSLRKSKRLINKRERLQIKKYLKGDKQIIIFGKLLEAIKCCLSFAHIKII